MVLMGSPVEVVPSVSELVLVGAWADPGRSLGNQESC